MKKLLVTVFSSSLLLLGACSGDADVAEYDIVPSELSTALFESDIFMDKLSNIENETAAKAVYAIPEEDVTSISVYLSSLATPEEIAVIEAVDAETAEEIMTLISTRVEEQITAYSDYGPEHVPMLEEAILATYGNYVVYITANDIAGAQEILDGFTTIAE